MSDPEYAQEIESRGFVVRRGVVHESVLRRLELAIGANGPLPDRRKRRSELFGMRNLLASILEVRDLACSDSVRPLVEPILGSGAGAVRGLYFDKTKAANWRLGWHQDKAIAVKDRIDFPGYGPWSIKAGVHHVFPPSDVLAEMLTVRVHLDPCDEASGALRVIPGSHRRLLADEFAYLDLVDQVGATSCSVDRGDVVVMRPLIVHASEESRDPTHRRVVHLEYAARPLPAPLAWNEYVSFGD